MIYVDRIDFPSAEQETNFFMEERRTCFSSYYPFQVLTARALNRLELAPLTILYGGNGCGKTTVLNILAQALHARRESAYNQSSFFPDYVALCRVRRSRRQPEECRMIASDDVFDAMLDLRALNAGVDRRREELFETYSEAKYSSFQLSSLQDYDALKQTNAARRGSQSRFVRERLRQNVRTYSNGENAYRYFTERIRQNGLYLLDEPENSLSAQRQIELAQFLADSARFYQCQLILSTHSPFLLAMPGAVVYDLEADPVRIRPWTELETIRIYARFFAEHAAELTAQQQTQATERNQE